MSSEENAAQYARDARILWLAIVLAVVLWGTAIFLFGYAGLIIPAVGLTFAIFVALVIMMRG